MTTFLKATEIPIRGARTLPGSWYTSPAVYERELERIFVERWLCACRAAEIANPGDFVVRCVGPESVIVTRDESGSVRAFYNVCRHRGSRICEEARGHFEEGIQCPYHAWTYALDGRLIGAPHMRGLEGFDPADYPLHAVAVAEWEGFVFINLSRAPEPFAQAFAPLIGRFARFGMPELVLAERITYDVRANWKLVHENYSECYHCSPVHPALVRLTPSNSGENDLYEGPFLGGYMVIAKPGGSLTMSGRPCGLPVGELPADDRQRVYYYSIFPNMLLSLHPDYVMVHTLWPDGPGRTHITCDWLFHPGTLSDPAYDPHDGVAFWDMTNRQDWHVCELSQLGVASRAYTPGPYAPRESLAAAFDAQVKAALGEGA
ncbi:MAG: aromatic ring-hydroxylating dioxygenase subunit alpha [Gemmatimonadaceae bacterium]|nr:aromatic ring-hydroxylating dioxygenase subunit alpha [Gemmatimonadaceae bacterium]